MIPAMTKAVFGLTPDEMGISVISMDSAFFKHVAVVFHPDRVHRRCAIVTDLDGPLIQLSEDPRQDNADQRHSRAAEIAGRRRYEALQAFSNNNDWVKAFFAGHTFEVDFLAAGNAHEVREVVAAIYSLPAVRKKVQKAINSADAAEAGTEILRLADKVGKGWFSLLLSERLSVNTVVPTYILRAVAFAATESLAPRALKQMGLFRLDSEEFSDSIKTALPPLKELRRLPAEDFITTFIEAAPEDDLTELIGYIREYVGG